MSPLPFRRIVLEFRTGAHSSEAVRSAAELAELLQLELFGRYVEDPGLAQLARTSFAREFRVLEGQWRELDSISAAASAELAIAAARRLFLQAAASAPVLGGFEVVRASAAPGRGRSTEEIVAIVQPAGMAEAAVPGDLPGEASAALLLPRHHGRRRGPVVAIGTSENDPALAMARAIALAAREPLVLMGWPPDPSAFIPANARLVVVDARRFTEIIRHVPALRGRIPILVVGPQRQAPMP